jgi:hypothetical protein
MGAKKSKRLQTNEPSPGLTQGFPGQPPMPQQLLINSQSKLLPNNSKKIEQRNLQHNSERPQSYHSKCQHTNSQPIREQNHFRNQIPHQQAPLNIYGKQSKFFELVKKLFNIFKFINFKMADK